MTRFDFRYAPLFCTIFVCAIPTFAQPDPPLVRYVQGSIHGFLEMRSQEGRIVASGEILQSVRGDRVTL